MLYVGIDVAKNKHDVTALNVQGKTVLKPLTFSNNKAGFELLDLSLRQLNQDCLIALEDTGHYAFNLLNFLHEQGYKVYTYNPLLIKEFAKSLSLRKTKTDINQDCLIALKLLSDPNREQFQHDNRQVDLKIWLDIFIVSRKNSLIGKYNTLVVLISSFLSWIKSLESIQNIPTNS
ncbi:degenerate transposase [Streptococcus pneumoniae]|nr:degenerate transposase [Streptococcus pneumoniae]CJF59216.1 degenerate transposase [Streptococcus pneumoniae]CJF89345.1 degenerate transposase [Streptococcus pneumoniae]CJX35116.1 degenerate transposase [Streptococcus pneumoniae]